MDGNDLRDWRRRHHITQQRLAALLGVHPITVTNWERGQYAIPDTMLALALEALDARLAAAPTDDHHSAGEG